MVRQSSWSNVDVHVHKAPCCQQSSNPKEMSCLHRQRYETHVQAPGSMEPHGCVAHWSDEGLKVWLSTQAVKILLMISPHDGSCPKKRFSFCRVCRRWVWVKSRGSARAAHSGRAVASDRSASQIHLAQGRRAIVEDTSSGQSGCCAL